MRPKPSECKPGSASKMWTNSRLAIGWRPSFLPLSRSSCAPGRGFGTFGTAGAGLRVPCHHIEMRPGDAGLDKLLEVECRGHRPGMRRFRNVVEIGDLAIDHLAIGPPQRHSPHRVVLGPGG